MLYPSAQLYWALILALWALTTSTPTVAFVVVVSPPPQPSLVAIEQVVAPASSSSSSIIINNSNISPQFSNIAGSSWLNAAWTETTSTATLNKKNPNTPAPRIKLSTPAFTQPASGYGPDAEPALAGKDPQPVGFLPTNCATAAPFPKATLCPGLESRSTPQR